MKRSLSPAASENRMRRFPTKVLTGNTTANSRLKNIPSYFIFIKYERVFRALQTYLKKRGESASNNNMASFQELQQLVEGGERKHVCDVRRDCTKTI